MRPRLVFPFTAIVGQESIKLALLLNAISPTIGGVLIRGHKGTAKSTAVRALAHLLPDIEVVTGCPFGCAPADTPEACPHCAVTTAERQPYSRPASLVELPLGATEDRVVGTLDIERALKTGEKHFESGLLAAAHRGLAGIEGEGLFQVLLGQPFVQVVDCDRMIRMSLINRKTHRNSRFRHRAGEEDIWRQAHLAARFCQM